MGNEGAGPFSLSARLLTGVLLFRLQGKQITRQLVVIALFVVPILDEFGAAL